MMIRRKACLLAALLQLASALYFYLPEGSSKCFLEEVPPDTLFVGNYKNPDFVPFGSPGFTGSVRHQSSDNWRTLPPPVDKHSHGQANAHFAFPSAGRD